MILKQFAPLAFAKQKTFSQSPIPTASRALARGDLRVFTLRLGTKDLNDGEKMNYSVSSCSSSSLSLFRVLVLYAGSLAFGAFRLLNETCWFFSARTHSRLRWRKREVSQMSHNMFASVLQSRSLYSVVESSSPRSCWPVNRILN